MYTQFNTIDKAIARWMSEYGVELLRISLALVFIWFGALKPLGLSPAGDLVAKTVYWFDAGWFVPFLGWWEVVIGVLLLCKKYLRFGIFLMLLQMAGTFLPIVLLPEIVFQQPPFILTLEGQYIIKNLVLITAAFVVGSHVRESHA